MPRSTIIIDPGHGRYGNPHTTKEGFYEGTQNYVLAEMLCRELRKKGFTVISTRPCIDDEPTLEERGRLAGVYNADLFLSLHSNAPASSTPKDVYPTIRGVCAFYTLTDPQGNIPLAQALVDCAAAVMGTKNLGIHTRAYPDKPDTDYYGVIRHSVASGCPRAILIEHGFHTNPEDSEFLQSTECLRRLAIAEAEVVSSLLS